MNPFANSDGALNLEHHTPVRDQVEQLFLEARDDVYYYVLSFGLGDPEAQEITQEAFLRFYVAAKRGDAIENPRGWLFRAAHNLALNAIERKGVRRRFTRNVEVPEADLALNPEQRLMRKQTAQRLRDAWSALSPKERLCLHLRADGLKYAEIAQTTGVGLSTVSQFLSRAVRKLRKATHE